MGYYKIKNVTNNLEKRHPKLNTTVTIDFSGKVSKNNISISPNNEVIVEATFLPISAQKLRIEGLITVLEIDGNTYQKSIQRQEVKNKENSTIKRESNKIESSEDKSKKNRQKFK